MTLVLGAVGLLIALISTALAWRAMKASDESAKAAQSSLRIAEEQHEEFMRERRALADFRLKLSMAKYPDAVVETRAKRIKLTWTLEVTNTGDKPATHVNVHFEAPSDLEKMQWVIGENDSLLTQRAGPFQRINQEIVTAGGVGYPSQFITKIVDRIGTRKGPRFSLVSGYLDTPPVGEERVVPVEMSVWSDDMGRTPMRTTSLDVTVRRMP